MRKSGDSYWLKWFKRLVFGFVGLVTLAALVLAVEGYRGKRAWLECKRELEARGESLNWRELAPVPVPDEQNMLATPLLARCFGFGTSKPGRAAEAVACKEELERTFAWAGDLGGWGGWRQGSPVSLEAWRTRLRGARPEDQQALARRYGLDTNAAVVPPRLLPAVEALRARAAGTAIEDLRFMLRQNGAELDELRSAATRPAAQMQLDPDGMLDGSFMSQLVALKLLSHPLRVSAEVALAAGESDLALRDIATLLKLGDAAGSQPLLIMGLVRLAIVDAAVSSIWAGLAEHRWSDAQLAELEILLGRAKLVEGMRWCLQGERVFATARIGPTPGATAVESELPPAFQYLPAVGYRNQINIARGIQALLIDRLDPAGPSVRLSVSPEDAAIRRRYERRTPYNLFAALLLPALNKTMEKTAVEQAAVSLARVGCALERHRLAEGEYPERLGELAPRFLDRLPPDPVTGEPMRYRREAPDRFVLYSLGLDLDDDGGAPAARGAGIRSETLDGDLVWPSAAVEAGR